MVDLGSVATSERIMAARDRFQQDILDLKNPPSK